MTGELSKPDDVEIHVEKFLLKDIGNGAYTEYEFGPEMIDLYDAHPELMQMRMGHMHTHHTMGVFFSGTDKKCLQDNAPSMDYFLSIIVNTAGDIIAKIAFLSEVTKNVSYIDSKKNISFVSENEKCLTTYDCEIVRPDMGIIAEMEQIKKIREEKKKARELEFSKNPHKNYSNPRRTINVSRFSKQGELFDNEAHKSDLESKAAYKEINNNSLMDDKSIENLLVRSLSLSDIESGELKNVVPKIREKLPDDDQSLYIGEILEHYRDSLQNEYYADQFEHVLSRSVNLLYGYNFRFVNTFRYYLKSWLETLESGRDNVDDLSIQYRREELIRYPETQIEHEF